MPLFKDLSPADRTQVSSDLAQNESLTRDLYLDAVRRAIALIAIALLGSAGLVIASTFKQPPSPLRIAALGCFLLGIAVLGGYLAIQFHALRKLLFQFSWFKFNVVSSQVDTNALVSPPQPIRREWISISLPYLASACWIAGISLLVFDLSNPRAAPSGYTAVAAPVAAPAVATSAPPPARSPVAEVRPIGGWSTADKLALAALLALVAQAVALIATLWVTRVTGRRQLRAFVGPETFNLLEGTILKPPDASKTNVPGAVVQIKNSGATTAYKVRIGTRIDVLEPVNEGTIVLPPLADVFASVLGPNVQSSSTAWFARPLTAGEIADVHAGARAIYLSGRIEYRDTFKKKRFTTFRLQYTGVFPPTGAAPMLFAMQGNDAD